MTPIELPPKIKIRHVCLIIGHMTLIRHYEALWIWKMFACDMPSFSVHVYEFKIFYTCDENKNICHLVNVYITLGKHFKLSVFVCCTKQLGDTIWIFSSFDVRQQWVKIMWLWSPRRSKCTPGGQGSKVNWVMGTLRVSWSQNLFNLWTANLYQGENSAF